MLTLRTLSAPRAEPSRAGSSGTVVPWQARCPRAVPHSSLPGRGDRPNITRICSLQWHLSSFTDVMTENMLKIGACSRQRDLGRHSNSQYCRHKTTAPCITAWMVSDFKSWLTSKIVKVMFADNCIHYDFFGVFIKLIKPFCFFPSAKTADKLYFIFSTENPCWQFQASCQVLWMAGAAGDTGRGHLPSGGWVWGGATVDAHRALLAAVTALLSLCSPFPHLLFKPCCFARCDLKCTVNQLRVWKALPLPAVAQGERWHVSDMCSVWYQRQNHCLEPLEDLPKDSASVFSTVV